ncbi:MAG: glutathione S-transferase family protein [Alphaproteobacteria bacterium]|nr:glutathione S-transferase family protein [Alphaproteobacteria bacterium]
MTIQLFHNPQSRATMMHWLLEELQIDYELVHVDYEDGSMRTPEFLEVSPMGKIPAIRDGELTVSDTVAIALYLADKYKTPNDLAPGVHDPRRGEYLRWLVFQASSVEPAMMQAGAKFETKRQQAGWGDVDTVVDVLETRLAKADPWLMGDWFTAADLVLGGAVNWALGWNLFPKKPALQAYAERIAERPAYKTVMGG